MAILKCKMCGGALEVTDKTVAFCGYCGTKQTLPKTTDEAIANLFNRANNLRMKCEFDKAEQVYEKIVEADDSEAEAHWGIVLCKYGIEYVEDPKTKTRIPTCHRTLYESVITNADYLAAIDYSDSAQQTVYEQEARAIDRIQKDILAISQKEKPFDVFICYKESDDEGKRTIDSTIANDIYYQLTNEGFKVFYAAITLEDKLGKEYEPYIFAALNSAKVMLVIGTKPEYFTAVWVKNEWSRYLKLMKTDRSKLLIPCYRDMNAYDLPEEFAHLQAQDMSKIGFINDVIRGIKKLLVTEEPIVKTVKEKVITADTTTGNVTALLKRGFMALEDGEWENADEFFEQCLNFDAELAEAYLGKLLASVKVHKKEELVKLTEPFDNTSLYQKVIRFGNADLKNYLTVCNESIKLNNDKKRVIEIFNKAVLIFNNAKTTEELDEAIKLFDMIPAHADSKDMIRRCTEKRTEIIYNCALNLMKSASSSDEFERAFNLLSMIQGYKNADLLILDCESAIEKARQKEEKEKLDNHRLMIFTLFSFGVVAFLFFLLLIIFN